MKKLILCLATVAGCLLSHTTTAQSSDAQVAPVLSAESPVSPDSPEMKAWMEYMTPGAMHKMLASFDGKWTESVTMWMAPDAPPMESKGTVENTMIMGGRYQQSFYSGDFNGMPFEGVGTLGYDNAKKVFVSSWVDNMGTGLMHLEGTWDEKKQMITLKGKCVDPMTGKDMEVRETLTIVDDKNQRMEMFMKVAGKEFKSMEMLLSRL